jgi:hypothetical protein
MNQNKIFVEKHYQQKQHGLMLHNKQRLIVIQGFFVGYVQLMKNWNENFVSFLEE